MDDNYENYNIPQCDALSELSLSSNEEDREKLIQEIYRLYQADRSYQEFRPLQAEERLAEEEARQIRQERRWESYVDTLVAQGYHHADAKRIIDCYYSIQHDEDLRKNKWLNAHGIYIYSNKYYND